MLISTFLLIVVSVGDVPEDMKRDMAMRLKKDGATRATSVGDLHERLHKKLEELRGSLLMSIQIQRFITAMSNTNYMVATFGATKYP